MITDSVATAIYGPNNPLEMLHFSPIRLEMRLVEAFYTHQDELNKHMRWLFPITLSIKGKRARDQLFEAFETYFANFANHSDQEPRDRPSELIEAQVQVGKQHNISSQDTARFEVHTLLQILVNPVQTCFWLLLHVFSDKDLLEPIRTDLMSSVYYQSSKIDRLYVNRLRSNAPLLFSAY